MLSRRKQYGAALLALLAEEGQQQADNLGKRPSNLLPDGYRWKPHGVNPTGSKSGNDSPVEIENDCEDQAVTPMPKTCLQFKCKKARLILLQKGFWICPECKGSYGK